MVVSVWGVIDGGVLLLAGNGHFISVEVCSIFFVDWFFAGWTYEGGMCFVSPVLLF